MKTLQEQMKIAVELKEKEKSKKYENSVFQPLPTLADFIK